jgi:hypothetical protein
MLLQVLFTEFLLNIIPTMCFILFKNSQFSIVSTILGTIMTVPYWYVFLVCLNLKNAGDFWRWKGENFWVLRSKTEVLYQKSRGKIFWMKHVDKVWFFRWKAPEKTDFTLENRKKSNFYIKKSWAIQIFN